MQAPQPPDFMVFTGNANPGMAADIADHLGISLGAATVGRYVYLVGGDDGGLWTSFNGGSLWHKNDNLPISQFYHVSIDDQDPYQVYGGLQDNSSWVGDSSYPGGITNSRWENLYGGDGFWVFSDPTDRNYVYAEYQGGNLAPVQAAELGQLGDRRGGVAVRIRVVRS